MANRVWVLATHASERFVLLAVLEYRLFTNSKRAQNYYGNDFNALTKYAIDQLANNLSLNAVVIFWKWLTWK